MAWGDKDDDDQDPGPWGEREPRRRPAEKYPPRGNQQGFEQIFSGGKDWFQDWLPSGSNGGGRGWLLVAAGAFVLWLATGVFFRVEPDEQGVVMRFGAFHRFATPGLNFRLPSPIEEVYKPKVTRVNRVEIGYRTAMTENGVNRSIPEESLMLTGDENIVDIDSEVQWKIRDAKKFLFNVRNPEETVKAAGESAMRDIVAKTPLSEILTEGRLKVELAAKDLLQHTLDQYDAGIEIVRLQMLKGDPPPEVIDAFRDVQTARADKEREQNEALSYRNDILPRARGQAEQMIQDAEAYQKEVVARSEGEASRFKAVYEEYVKAKDVTKKRMYLETMEKILTGMDKLILDSKTQPVPYLPLEAVGASKKEVR